MLTGTVMQVNARNKTFTVEVTFSAQNLKPFPAVGTIYDITFQRTPGGPLVAIKADVSGGGKFRPAQ